MWTAQAVKGQHLLQMHLTPFSESMSHFCCQISSQEPVDFQAELARKLGGGALPKPPTPRIADGDENDVEDDMSKSTGITKLCSRKQNLRMVYIESNSETLF